MSLFLANFLEVSVFTALTVKVSAYYQQTDNLIPCIIWFLKIKHKLCAFSLCTTFHSALSVYAKFPFHLISAYAKFHPVYSTTLTKEIWIFRMIFSSSQLLTIFLAISWGQVNQLGRSYVTQASPFWLAGWRSWEVETGKSATLPLPSPALQCSCGHLITLVSTFSWLYLTKAGSVSYWLERAAHSKSEWRRPIPLEWDWPARSYVTHTFLLYFTYSRFIYIYKYTLNEKTPEYKR